MNESDCDIDYFVPNIFTPNDDGINDVIEFYFNSEYEFSGELNIYDRWGNVVFQANNVDAFNSITCLTSGKVLRKRKSVLSVVPYKLDRAGKGLPLTRSNKTAGPPFSKMRRWISAISKSGPTSDLILSRRPCFSRSSMHS